jgi:ABC-type nitrate/sulfonate/bicarbonate transport system permease component
MSTTTPVAGRSAAPPGPTGPRPPTRSTLLDTRLSGLLLLVAICLLWDISARWKFVDLVSWPPFFDVARRWLQLVFNGEILTHLAPSLKRVAAGYAIAVAIAVISGILIGYSRRVFNLLEPTLEALRPISVIALIPVIVLFLGLEDRMKIFIIAYACFFPILLNTITGVRDVDPVLVDTARTFKLTKWQTIRFVVLPAATPFIFTGMRISVGFSLMAMVAAEMLTGGDGIGAFILDSQRTFKVSDMYAGIITLGVLGYCANRGFIEIERWLLRWQAAGGSDRAA